MKKIVFCLISLLACVGLTSSCSSDGEETNFSDGTELVIGGEEISSMTDVTGKIVGLSYDGDAMYMVKCFHSEEEVENSGDLISSKAYGEGNNATVDLPPVDWNRQTLVVAKCKGPDIGVYVSGKVIKKGEKYLVELSCYGLLTNIIRELDVLIVMNKPNLTEKNFLLKTTPAEIAGN